MSQFKFWLPLPVICFMSLFAAAQSDSSVYYLKNDGRIVSGRDSADIIRTVINPKGSETLYMVHDKYPNGNDKLITHATNKDGSLFQGFSIEFFSNGKKRSDEFFKDDVLLGPISVYYPNGKLYMSGDFSNDRFLRISQYRDSTGTIIATDGNGEGLEYDVEFKEITGRGRIEKSLKTGRWIHFNGNKLWYSIIYEKGRLQSGIGYDSVGKEYPFDRLEEPAYFNSRMESLADFIKRKTKYPDEAKKANIRGSVHLSFVIEKNGELTNIKVMDGLGYGTEKEAVRVLTLTAKQWLPALQFGLAVRREYSLPVNFGLSSTHSSFKL